MSVWLQEKLVNDVFDADVGASHQADEAEHNQKQVLGESQPAAVLLEGRHLDHGGQHDAQNAEAEGAEQGDEQLQVGHRGRQQDCKQRERTRFYSRTWCLDLGVRKAAFKFCHHQNNELGAKPV